MKIASALIFLFFINYSVGQKLTIAAWDTMALMNKRLLPKYGQLPKTDAEKKADAEFIADVLTKDSSRSHASSHLIGLGFKYMQRQDFKTAMYRFNQAYLLDSNNVEIHWGYGSLYFNLGDYQRAREHFIYGLKLNPKNKNLLREYGTIFLSTYYALEPKFKTEALKNLDSAIVYLDKVYQQDQKDDASLFKLSVCYWNKGDCKNAKKFHELLLAVYGGLYNKEYAAELEKKCK